VVILPSKMATKTRIYMGLSENCEETPQKNALVDHDSAYQNDSK